MIYFKNLKTNITDSFGFQLNLGIPEKQSGIQQRILKELATSSAEPTGSQKPFRNEKTSRRTLTGETPQYKIKRN